MRLPCPVCREEIKLFCEKCPHCLSDLNKSDDDGLGFFEWLIVIVILYFIFTW